ncbi:hypothetical protein PanWU01x14_363510, partial [Parasponia andersonii]
PITGGDTRILPTKPGWATALPTPVKWEGNQKKYPTRVHRLSPSVGPQRHTVKTT